MASILYADRTPEFRNIHFSLKQSSSYGHDAVIPMPSATTLSVREQAGRFNAFAQTVTLHLTATHEMLENLTSLVRESGHAFDEASEDEIGQLTSAVKQRLSQLHRDVEQLGALMASTRSQHTDVVVSSLRIRLMNTTKEFKHVLNTRTESLSDSHKRRSRYSYDKEDQESSVPEEERMLLLASAGTTNASHYRSRTAAVRQIEATVHEMSAMFQDFARLMEEQESLIRRIDDDVGDALLDVNEGQAQLLKYLNKISSNRGLILKVFMVLFAFVLFFGLVVVSPGGDSL